MATVWNLDRMRQEIRKITGRFDDSQITSQQIDDYINDFYLYDFPEELRSLKLKDYYDFVTIPNVGEYTVPQNTFANPQNTVNPTSIAIDSLGSNQAIYNVMPPVYVDGYQSAWYQDPDVFQRIWPQLDQVQKSVKVTVAGQFIYTFQLFAVPILQGSVMIGCSRPDQTTVLPDETFRDISTPNSFVNPGVLYRQNALTGTVDTTADCKIDYLTGQVSVEFSVAPNPGIPINAHFWTYVASRPRDIMWFNQKLTLRPVPNDSYRVRMVAQYQPTVVLDAKDTTLQSQFDETTAGARQTSNFFEWWQLLVYGASLKIFITDGDHEEYERNRPYYEMMKLEAQRRCLKQMSNQRINTIYSDNIGLTPPFPPYPIY